MRAAASDCGAACVRSAEDFEGGLLLDFLDVGSIGALLWLVAAARAVWRALLACCEGRGRSAPNDVPRREVVPGRAAAWLRGERRPPPRRRTAQRPRGRLWAARRRSSVPRRPASAIRARSRSPQEPRIDHYARAQFRVLPGLFDLYGRVDPSVWRVDHIEGLSLPPAFLLADRRGRRGSRARPVQSSCRHSDSRRCQGRRLTPSGNGLRPDAMQPTSPLNSFGQAVESALAH